MTSLQIIQSVPGVATRGPNPVVTDQAGRPDLCRVFAVRGFTKGAEIGVWQGGFSERLCQSVPHLDLTCVDPWASYADYRGEKKNDPERLDVAYRETKQRLKPYGCRILRMTSVEAATHVPDGSLDFVYLDGNHLREFVLQDLEIWTPKIRKDGIMAGHDYRTQPAKPFIQVEAAVDEFTRARGIDPWFVFAAERSPSFLWVIR